MRDKRLQFILRLVYLLLIVASIVLFVFELTSYSIIRANYPFGMSLGNVPVGGLNPQEAAQRVLQVYYLPIEIHYGDAVIHLDPGLIGYQVDIESMIAAADLERTNISFWGGFWNYLWSRPSSSINVPLISSVSDLQIRNYLSSEISPRYDKLPSPAQLIPGTTDFKLGAPGRVIDIEHSLQTIKNALNSSSNRVVVLSSQNISAMRPSFENLQLLIKQIITDNSFDGIIGVYLLDLQTAQELHFGYKNYESISVNPDIAFTASSTIKIPIMVSVFKQFSGVLDNTTSNYMDEMLKLSENPAADSLMQLLNKDTGPVIVTQDLKQLGLKSTFIAGYFFDNAPNLLPFYATPANSRTDLTTDPDWYSQTTPSEMGMLLEDIYQCSETGGGALVVNFPGRFSKQSCQQMISYLKEDKIGLLIEAGVPDGTSVAHKHGWVLDVNTGVYHDISDAAIVYSPGGNYILTIYAYHPVQVIWEYPVTRLGAARMFADISRVIYNYFNLPSQ